MKVARIFLLLLPGILLAQAAAAQELHSHPAGDPQQLGEVHFATSCEKSVQEKFDRAVAMLHSFWYELAAAHFTEIAQQDPSCAMAYWGIAMTFYHPVWPDRPDAATLKKGWSAVEKSRATGAKTSRERDYIAAMQVFYKDADKLEHLARVRAYEKAMEQISHRYPDDSEAAIFYALSILGTAYSSLPDKSYTKHQQAGAILETLFTQQPEHPGLAHYIIHSYDFPPLAARALEAARRYARIAPDSPHAQHMPSHIFTRLGLWEESIASNLNSAASAHRHGIAGEELHAKDYLMYAYLQLGQDRKAKQLLEELPENRPGTMLYFAGLYALAAMPARHGLERGDWAAATNLELPVGLFPGGRYAWTEATFHFARGLGAARTGDVSRARNEAQRLEVLKRVLLQEGEKYWAEQVEVQRRAVAAWQALAEGGKTEALAVMRSAADLEDSMDKSPVTPGAVVPARELLGEMLLQTDQPREALQEFEAVLRAAPNRFNALYGAAQAAERLQDQSKAEDYYKKLLKLAESGDGDRPALKTAASFLAKK